MLFKLLPGLDFTRWYKLSNLPSDIIAGITVAVMLVPQGMAYAMIAGLPPVYGLYASTLPLIVYPLFGSSRHLSVGPAAIMSLLVYVTLSRIVEIGSEQYIGLAIILAFAVGIIQVILGFLKMGFISNFFSRAVISGFASAAAIIVCFSQLKHILGLDVPGEKTFLKIIQELVTNLDTINYPTLILGVTCIMVLALFKYKMPKFPRALLVVVGSILLVYFLKLEQWGIDIIRDIPSGFPAFALPSIQPNDISILVTTIILIVFVGYMESIAIAQLIADKENYKVDPDREFKGLGFANIAGSLFSSFPVAGGFSRTAVNYQVGAKSGIASIITGLIVIVALIYLTPFLYYLPEVVLASIIIIAVSSLIDIHETMVLFKIKFIDGVILIVTFLSTLFFGIELGLVIGIVFSLLVYIWRSAHPHTAELGFVEDKRVFRNILRFPEAKTFKGAVILRVDASLFFANMGFVEETLRKAIIDKPDIKWVIMDLTGVNDMDAVSIKALDRIMATYKQRGIRFAFAGMKGPVRDLVKRDNWHEKYGEHSEYLTLRHALHELGLWDKTEPPNETNHEEPDI